MWLVVQTGPDAGSAIELPEGGTVVLGRQRGCEIVVRDARASRRHAEISEGGGRIVVRDLGSANGTYVDGARITESTLEGGDEVRIGQVVIALQHTAPPGGTKSPAPAGDVTPADLTAGEMPQLATHSMVRRMVEAGTRRANRTALVAAGLGAAGLVVVVLLLTGVIGGGGGERVPQVVSALARSTVLVETDRGGTRTGNGSGWVLDAGNGLIVTNAHVVNQGDTFRVIAGGRSQPAQVVGVAPCEDLALLRIANPSGLKTAALAAPGSIEQGETVVALGYGADAQAGDSVGSTTGVVSGAKTSFRDPAPDVPAYPQVVQTDTALNPGNSGGPLVDLDSKVIGVDSAARTTGSDGRPLQNLNYAIAIDRARSVLTQLQAGHATGWTGLTFGYPTADDLRRAGLPPGLRVTGAIPGTPAARAAIHPGDLLAGVNGRAINATLSSYCAVAGGLRTGEQVELDFAVPGSTRTRQVRLPWHSARDVEVDVVALVTVPFFSGAIGYITNWSGVWMLFYPVRFRGFKLPGLRPLVAMLPRKVQQIPGFMHGAVGWQGIIPSRAAKMGSIAVDKGIAKLGSAADFYQQLEPDQIAEHILETSRGDMREVVERIMRREHPALWRDLPPRVRETVHERVQQQLPGIVRSVTEDIGRNIDQLLDVKLMVIRRMEEEPELANRMYLEVGGRELRFITNFGFFFGFLLGVPVAVITEVLFHEWWLLPIFGVLIGYVTNLVAIHMIFEPVSPRHRIGRWTVQGLFLKRQDEAGEVYARIVADDIVTLGNIGRELLHGPRSDRTRQVIEAAMRPAVDQAVGLARPAVRVAVGTREYDAIRSSVASEAVEYTMTPLVDPEFNRRQGERVRALISRRIREMAPADFSEMLRTAMREDEWLLYLHGAVLGLGAGLVHLAIFG